jgi:hypothetical protein
MNHVLTTIFFRDIPALLDSAWRRGEYELNAEAHYQPGPPPNQTKPAAEIQPRSFWTKPAFWFFAITVFFVSYGPTWGGLCATAPQIVIDVGRYLLAAAIVLGSLWLVFRLWRKADALICRRFTRLARDGETISPARRRVVFFIAYVFLALLAVAGVSLGVHLSGLVSDPHVCVVEGGNRFAFARFIVCVAAVAAFGVIASYARASSTIVYWQAIILGLVVLVHWLFLAPAGVREADDLPYRHVFGLWAPAIIAVLVLAPWLARRIFGTVPPDDCRQFQQWLRETELFVNRRDPELTGRRLFHAFIYGPAYHPLHLLLIPSLVALVLPPESLYAWTFFAFAVSVLMLVWGNISSRWDQLNVHIERWFLRGTPFFVSLLVIVLAVLRILQVDYISTLLDALPFGTIFGLIVMTYVLFWLVEYWMNRIVIAELLRVLGSGTSDVYTRYAPSPGIPTDPQDPIRVRRAGRFLVGQGSGRLVAVGTIGDLDAPAPDAATAAANAPAAPANTPAAPAGAATDTRPPRAVAAFEGYYLADLFARLGERAHTLKERARVIDINHRTGNYFFFLNLLLIVVTAGFITVFAVRYLSNNGTRPVVETTAPPPAAEQLIDLSGLLLQQPEKPARPAIVVVGSGGGTRAALYTASVLNGLHRLGVDRDIVLVSGVSGGGVALAYFAANSGLLTGQSPPAAARRCPDSKGPTPIDPEWNCFNKAVTSPFIEDVLNGATEWRIFSTTALSALLAESFDRTLFGGQTTLGSVKSPGLILNAAIVSHPAEDTDALKATLERGKSCKETERSYQLMSGGRLIFTNLRHTAKFPPKQAPHIPDVRLPYEIVQAADVSLAKAAALNANFPPVFPTARVRMRNDGSSPCPRSYYVTDGGAQENLGLVSALYALESALEVIPQGAALRPIHVVIAEASAVTYDYSQDRGFGALFASRERLAGGLTNALIDRVEGQLKRVSGAKTDVNFHYLGLPLAFRARGGFGTHWMYAKQYNLSDPRPRTIPWRNYLPFDFFREGKVTVDRNALEELWLGLHDRDIFFCDRKGEKQFKSPEARKVQAWVCGSGDPNGRDLHMGEWKNLVARMESYGKP